MADLINGAVIDGGDEIVATEPLSIRDSLKAAMTGEEAPDQASQDRARDEAGRFAAKTSEVQAQPVAAPAAKAPEQQPVAPVVPVTAATPDTVQPTPEGPKPPPGWSADAKASFGTLPPHVQEAISKREQEVDNGFKVLQDYKGLEQFTPYVKAAGTTFASAMEKALSWEASLQRDPVNTVLNLAKIANVDIIRLAAQLQQSPQPHPQTQQAPPPRVNVEQTVEQVLRKRDVETQLNTFLSDPANVHAEALIDDMAALISTGRAKDLKEAYDTACWMRPDIRSQLINQAAPQPAPATPKANPADQARRAAKSITGSSAPGPSKDAGAVQPSSIRDSLKQAFSTQGNRA